MMNRVKQIVLFPITFAFLAACVQTDAEPNPPPTAEHHHQRGAPPMVLSLQGQSGAGGLIDLTATLDLRHSHALPITVHVDLPPGAVLVSGQSPEVLAPPHPMTLSRNFQVRVVNGAPVRVTAQQGVPGKLGVFAQRSYPAEAPTAIPVPKAITPVNIGGVVIDRAIPLPSHGR